MRAASASVMPRSGAWGEEVARPSDEGGAARQGGGGVGWTGTPPQASGGRDDADETPVVKRVPVARRLEPHVLRAAG